ncbi:MMPL family transporter [Streptomyces sp. XM4193]|uniref:MMPL family transporter n=1 Tax=Streptomyces sp. XM4193 TaxID=2929782 RepID=UPI001FFA6664|nr:MMPL family transporter [Streptomyces sp. XM4193]MCK1798364.1 MMPL family transporter [Streptomyces sp. XM4193]
MQSRTTRRLRWLLPCVLLVVWLAVGGGLGPFAGKLGEVSTNDQSNFLPQSAESTRVLQEQRELRQPGSDDATPAIVVWVADDDGEITDGQRAAAARALSGLGEARWSAGPASPPIVSEDGSALQAVVQVRADLPESEEETQPEPVELIEQAAQKVPGTEVYVAGPAATAADLSEAFAGIDGLLLSVALGVVLLILLLVYRSVLLPFVVIMGSVFALALACAVVYLLADRDVLRVDGQVQGILFILVIGAATDYALLLTARFREELAAPDTDRFGAMRAALRRSAGAITASAATVALGLLALLLSDLTNNRALGPVGAIGIVCSVLSVLTFLPAALVLLGRAAYWPARPRPAGEPYAASAPAAGTGEGAGAGAEAGTGEGAGAEAGAGAGAEAGAASGGAHVARDRSGRLWGRVAALVDRSPRRVWVLSLAGLLAAAAFSPMLNSQGVPLKELFVGEAKSVTAQERLSEHFPGGAGNPAVIIADAEHAQNAVRAADGVEGVASVRPAGDRGPQGADRVRIDATLADAADSDAARETVQRLRDTFDEQAPEANALVGGYTAQQYDTQQTAAADRALIAPVVLLIILVILIGLLRSLLMPLLLVATVALNFLATIGVAALVFDNLLGFSGTDASVPLYGFVFLVALGVDYNIFLMTRVREETLRHGTRLGVLRGLTATGGVITSAGVVLAATFAALGVIPLAFLVQIAFIVAFGVLLDTLVVRSLLVPALVRELGPRAWWPGRPDPAAPAADAPGARDGARPGA